MGGRGYLRTRLVICTVQINELKYKNNKEESSQVVDHVVGTIKLNNLKINDNCNVILN